MYEVEPVQRLAHELGRDAFVRRFKGLFLLKRPADVSGDSWSRIDYETEVLRPGDEPQDPLGDDWRVIELKKRPGNPFPERISVGRAGNCDVVIRAPFISKLHAHFIADDDGNLRLADNKSANGSYINEQPVAPGDTPEVGPGDRVAFGPLILEVVDANALYEALADLDLGHPKP